LQHLRELSAKVHTDHARGERYSQVHNPPEEDGLPGSDIVLKGVDWKGERGLESASQNTTLKTLGHLWRALRCQPGDLFGRTVRRVRLGRRA
jgi:hypothetical protein